jgi:hypothetical protein
MERRRDNQFRDVVNAVQPALTARGFRVADRGTLEALARVDFQRTTRGAADELPGGQYLVLYHLGGHALMGARLSRYRLPEAADVARDEAAVWPYEPRTLTTATGQPVARELRQWVDRALAADAD